MIKKLFYSLILIVIISLLAIFVNYFNYKNYQKELFESVPVCSVSNDDYYDAEKGIVNCYSKMYENIITYLLVNKAFVKNKPLQYTILPPSYVCSNFALEQADAMIGYGVFGNIDAEEKYSKTYNKHSYSFDCGISKFEVSDERCHFESSCIGTDEFILKEENQVSSGKIHTFGQKLKELGFQDKKVFIKMDIAGAEGYVLEDVIKYSKNITGMSIVFRLKSAKEIYNDIKILKLLQKDFVLVARADHSFQSINKKKCRYMHDSFSEVIVLSFVNKNLVDKYYIDWNQTSIQTYNPDLNWEKHEPTSIDKVVILDKKIKNLFKK